MEKIDLHIHTAASDGKIDLGRDLPALCRGYRLMAIADHEHIFDPSAFPPGSFGTTNVISGVEICCHHDGRNMEILGYDFDPKDPAITALVEHVRNLRIEKLTEILKENGLDGQPLPPNPCRLHVKFPPDIDPAAFWGRYNAAYKAQNHSVPARTVIDTILAAGGVPVFAHPMESLAGMGPAEVERFILSLGVETVELITPKHTGAEVAMVGDILRRHRLHASIGSDSHQATLRPVGHPYDLSAPCFDWIRERLPEA